VPGHSNTRGFDLTIRDPSWLQTLEPVFTEADLAATSGYARHAPPHLLSVLNFFRHQHN
jgi:hypothetical protein